MKETLTTVIDRIEKDNENKVDYQTFTGNLHMDQNGMLAFKRNALVGGYKKTDIPFELSDWAEGQILTKLGMPIYYFRKLKKEEPRMYAEHFNYWANREDGGIRLRARDYGDSGLIRGVVSDAYSPLDNDLVIDMIKDVLVNLPDPEYEIDRFNLDEKFFHLRITYPNSERNLGTLPGDMDGATVDDRDKNRVGTDFMNSEVGASSLSAAILIWRLICSNGLKGWGRGDDSFIQRHIHADRRSVFERMKNAVEKQIYSGSEKLDKFQELKQFEMQNPFFAIARLSQNAKHSQNFSEAVKDFWEGDHSAYGVVNAYTRAANHYEMSLDQRLEVENFAGKLVYLPQRRWQELDRLPEEEEQIAV